MNLCDDCAAPAQYANAKIAKFHWCPDCARRHGALTDGDHHAATQTLALAIRQMRQADVTDDQIRQALEGMLGGDAVDSEMQLPFTRASST
jgi:hypothetical protein